MAHNLEGTVSDNLVSVHIGGSTCTALNHIAGEVVVVLALHNLTASLSNTLILSLGQKAELVVSLSSAKLGHCQTVDEQGVVVEVETADGEVYDTAQCLHAIESLNGHLHLTEKVALDTSFT